MECQFEIFSDGKWLDCAIVTVPNPELGGVRARSVFEYDLHYVFGENAGPVSLSLPIDAQHDMLESWPAFLFDLIPQGSGRKFLLGELGLPDDKSSDFALVRAGAFNPIGRLRVREAVSYFANHVARHPQDELIQGMTLDQVLARGDQFAERMMVHSMLAAGTTGVQGAAPKFLLTRDRRNLWHADGALPDNKSAAHFIVKLPRGKAAADKKVLRNEAAYMATAAAVGLRVHPGLTYENDMLFVPRFDRAVTKGGVTRLHQESAASIAGVVGFDARPSQFDLIHALRGVVTNKESETLEFLKRDVLNLAMRNTDNHARNTAVQIVDGEVRLTPLFDFAPMYLDPEGIARAARWYHPEKKKELVVWGDVIDALDMPSEERGRIRAAMANFGQRIEGLSQTMRECGVEDDIIAHLDKGLEEQVRQLHDLAPPSVHPQSAVKRKKK